jgi:hypothetical protein
MVEDKKYFVRVLASLVIMLVATILMKFLVGLPTFLAVFSGNGTGLQRIEIT